MIAIKSLLRRPLVFLPLLTLFFVLPQVSVAASYNVSNVGLYYESLCPYSRGFITGSLNDAYKSVPELFTLSMVPYGLEIESKQKNGTYSYTCQHGKNECVGNQEECCVIYVFPDYNVHYPIIECMSADEEPWNALDRCSQGQNMTAVHECYDSGYGTVLEHQAKLKQQQLNPSLGYVPWITINDTHDDDEQNAAYSDLTAYLCSLQSSGNCPPGCLSHIPPVCGN